MTILPARRRLAAGLVGGFLLGNAGGALAQSCAMCATALADDPLGRAISWSILFMMATPYAIVGTIATWLYFTYRRAGRRQAALTPSRLREAPAGEGSGGDLP
jgi:nitrate/nitrite transporter NarK